MDDRSQRIIQSGLKTLRLVFCGTPNFAVPTLKHLLAQPDFEILAVITQPDRPRGRGHEVSFSPVKETALAASLPVFQPEKIRTPESEQFLRTANPDAIVIIAYGQIIPARLLTLPKFGWINSHASLLPKYRGAAPIQWAIANGETKTGITIMRIDAGMDTGEMLLQQETPIDSNETTPELATRLAEISAPLMAATLHGLRDSTIHPKPQSHGEASLAPLLKKDDGRVDWSLPAQTIFNRMRAFTPWPGSYSTFRGTPCQLLFSSTAYSAASRAVGEMNLVCAPVESSPALRPAFSAQPTPPPGTLTVQNGGDLLVSCGQETLLRLSRVKLEGRKQVSALDFANGNHVQSGERFV
jgi:methionyl-tRNA formyltransferase